MNRTTSGKGRVQLLSFLVSIGLFFPLQVLYITKYFINKKIHNTEIELSHLDKTPESLILKLETKPKHRYEVSKAIIIVKFRDKQLQELSKQMSVLEVKLMTD